jgi:hypothetical protein
MYHRGRQARSNHRAKPLKQWKNDREMTEWPAGKGVKEATRVNWSMAREAVAVVESGHRIFVQGACATPTVLLQALVDRG